jgi:NADPH:quinone reductase-like Zn-dependent oxidoreductase
MRVIARREESDDGAHQTQRGEITMKAVQYASYGGPDVLKVVDIEQPQPGAGEVLVRVTAAGVNPVDWRIRDGSFRYLMELQFPVTPGCDICGVVENVGDGDERLLGQEVFAFLGTTGAFAEYIVAPRHVLVKKPASLDHVHAAAVPLAALTAWQALFDQGDVKSGQRVLVHAAGGGVGGFAVQFASVRGAHVIATASRDKHDYVRSLGAREVIDYREAAFETKMENVDVVIDLLGGDVFERSKKVLVPGGVVVTAQGMGAGDPGVRQVYVSPNAAQLTEIGALIDAGRITVTVSETFALAKAAIALEASKAGGVRGKLVLEM